MYIGVDIGGTKCAVVKADVEGNIIEKIRFETSDFKTTIDNIVNAVKSFGEAEAIGISCGGPLDSKRGVIMSPPNLPGWDDVEIVKMLEETTGIKAYLQNDANACALAEWQHGAGKGTQNMIFLTFGTGMGAGLILNGRLYEGTNGNAGEVGHIRLCNSGPVGYGKAGSFEGFCSGGGIARQARAQAETLLARKETVSYCNGKEDLDNITAKRVAECAQNGHRDALDIYVKCGKKLGKALAVLIDVLNPERIVIGSIYERSGELLKDAMHEVLKKECLPQTLEVCEIVPAVLGDSIGDHAAVTVAMLGDRA